MVKRRFIELVSRVKASAAHVAMAEAPPSPVLFSHIDKGVDIAASRSDLKSAPRSDGGDDPLAFSWLAVSVSERMTGILLGSQPPSTRGLGMASTLHSWQFLVWYSTAAEVQGLDVKLLKTRTADF